MSENKVKDGGASRFVVEADTLRNGDILLAAIPGVRLRGAIDSNKPVIADPQQNVRGQVLKTVPLDQAAGLGQLPKIPGQQLELNNDGSYRIHDPLNDPGGQDTLEGLRQGMAMRGSTNVLKPVPDKTGTLDPDRFKTLCEEVLDLVDAGHMKLVRGILPTREELEKLKGRVLLNPGSIVPNSQPKYRDELESWQRDLAKVGG